jgi:hypothetical protein
VAIFAEMWPFVMGLQPLKQPKDSMWCASVCWDIVIASCIKSWMEWDEFQAIKQLVEHNGKHNIYILKNGFVSDLIKANTPITQADPKLTSGATNAAIENAVIKKLNMFEEKYKFIPSVELQDISVLGSPLLDTSIGEALSPSMTEMNAYHKRMTFIMLTYTKEGTERGGELSHRLLVAGKGSTDFTIADTDPTKTLHEVAINGLVDAGRAIMGTKILDVRVSRALKISVALLKELN